MGAAVFAFALVLRYPFVAEPGFPADQAQFVMWSARATSSGVASVYALRPDGSGRRFCNYPPGYVYVLRLLGGVYERLAPEHAVLDEALGWDLLRGSSTPATRLAVALHKTPAIIADALLAALLVVWLSRRTDLRLAALVGAAYAAMPVVIHNSALWGQVDAIPTLLMVASLEMARRRRAGWMAALAALAVLTKAQAAVLLPVWLAAAILANRMDWRAWLTTAGVAAVIAAIVLLPFVGVLDGVWAAYAGAANYYPYTHLNGFSAWFLGNPLLESHLTAELPRFYLRDYLPGPLGISPRHWGLFGVLLLWTIVAVALLRRRNAEHPSRGIHPAPNEPAKPGVETSRPEGDDSALLWAARLLPLVFFVLSTQMHERYLYPAVAIWAWAFVPSVRWWIGWVLLALAAAINAMWVWAGPPSAPWASWCEGAWHQTWLGLAPGSWCGLVLVALLLLCLFGWFDGVKPLGDLRRAHPTRAHA
jgi:hypothetical protein